MTRHVVTRVLLVIVGVLLLLAAVSPVPARAASTAALERDGEPLVMMVNGRALVDRGDVVDDVWIANGRALIDGRVEGSVVVLNGDAVVKGSIGGDVTVVRGGVWIGPDSVVRGDVRASEPITVSEGAVVDGTVREVSVLDGARDVLSRMGTALWIGLTIALLGLGAIALLSAGATFERAGRRVVDQPFGSLAKGLSLLVLLPIAALVTAATIIGGLLGLLLLALAALAAVAGLVVVAHRLGQWLLPGRSTPLRFVVGAAILRIVALIPFLGPVITVIAAATGAGALLSALRDRRPDDDHDQEDQMSTPIADESTGTVPAVAAVPSAGAPADEAVNLDLRPGRDALSTIDLDRLDELVRGSIDESPEVVPTPGEGGQQTRPGSAPTSARQPGRLRRLGRRARAGASGHGGDATDADDAPSGIPGSHERPPVDPTQPEILASLPIEDDDDIGPQRAPRPDQPLFADTPVAEEPAAAPAVPATPEVPEMREVPEMPEMPEVDEVVIGNYRGPLFAEPDPARMPTADDSDPANGSAGATDTMLRDPGATRPDPDADDPIGPVAGDELEPGGLFSGSARAWRPSRR